MVRTACAYALRHWVSRERANGGTPAPDAHAPCGGGDRATPRAHLAGAAPHDAHAAPHVRTPAQTRAASSGARHSNDAIPTTPLRGPAEVRDGGAPSPPGSAATSA